MPACSVPTCSSCIRCNTTPEDRAILKARGVSYSIVADRRVAPAGERRRDPGRRTARRRRQGLAVDRPHHDLQLRLLRRHAHALLAAPASPRQQDQAHDAAPGGACHHRRRARSRHRRQGRLAHARQARRSDPVRTTDINMAPVGDPFDALVALAQPTMSIPWWSTAAFCAAAAVHRLDHAKVAQDAADSAAALRARARIKAAMAYIAPRCGPLQEAPMPKSKPGYEMPDRRDVILAGTALLGIAALPRTAAGRGRARARFRRRSAGGRAQVPGGPRCLTSARPPRSPGTGRSGAAGTISASPATSSRACGSNR